MFFFFSCLKKLNFFFHVQNIFILLYSTNKISMPSIIFFLLVRCAHSPSVPSPSSLLSICKQLLKFAGPFFFTSQEMTSQFPWRYRICCRRSQTNHPQSYINKNKKKRTQKQNYCVMAIETCSAWHLIYGILTWKLLWGTGKKGKIFLQVNS